MSVKAAPETTTLATARAALKPGEKRGLRDPNGTFYVVCGRVPYDGSTRQQRRAVERGQK